MMPSRTREGQVEAATGGIALFKPGNDAQGVQVVVEAETMLPQCGIERFLTGVAEGGMADVVRQGKGLGEFAIQAQRCGERAGDLGDFKRVGEAAAEVVGGQIAEQGGRRPGSFRPAGERRAREECGRRRARRENDRDAVGSG